MVLIIEMICVVVKIVVVINIVAVFDCFVFYNSRQMQLRNVTSNISIFIFRSLILTSPVVDVHCQMSTKCPAVLASTSRYCFMWLYSVTENQLLATMTQKCHFTPADNFAKCCDWYWNFFYHVHHSYHVLHLFLYHVVKYLIFWLGDQQHNSLTSPYMYRNI